MALYHEATGQLRYFDAIAAQCHHVFMMPPNYFIFRTAPGACTSMPSRHRRASIEVKNVSG